MRTYCSGWYQVPLLFSWVELVVEGERPARNGVHPEPVES